MLDVIKLLEHEKWEDVPDEDLWEDGEISQNTCMIKIFDRVFCKGDWKLMRRKDEL